MTLSIPASLELGIDKVPVVDNGVNSLEIHGRVQLWIVFNLMCKNSAN